MDVEKKIALFLLPTPSFCIQDIINVNKPCSKATEKTASMRTVIKWKGWVRKASFLPFGVHNSNIQNVRKALER